jgi:hypothetical protein
MVKLDSIGSSSNLGLKKEKSYLDNIHRNTINLNAFPNEPHKQIDYVIVYKKFSDEELKIRKNDRAHKIRELFFDKLIMEEFEIYEIDFKKIDDKKNENYVYALLHASNARLLEEADQMSFEMKVRNVRRFSYMI